eukprot:CAMPEP_0197508388 /NCGR_PEP_ID=MMETSP1312-20131121/28703_1 /TAXON_ID=464262 /ORGANISM="Genus nov. species nov., Strain RCC2335" /LENGTH=48 /DNA_ID= /DNA_START= /DNA_END= /DNA_ORIENTATION=
MAWSNRNVPQKKRNTGKKRGQRGRKGGVVAGYRADEPWGGSWRGSLVA